MRYVINSGSFYEVPLTSGTVQNTGNVPIEISDTETFRSGIVLNPGEKFSWDNATLYARVTYFDKDGVLAVVPFKKAAGGGGGDEYILPVATTSRLGGVKSSTTSGNIRVNSDGTMTYNAPEVEPISAPTWETGTTYPVNALVEYDGNVYLCLTAHTSGVFADDLAGGKWKLVSMTLQTATSSTLGGVKSSSAFGKVSVNSDGTMSMNGNPNDGTPTGTVISFFGLTPPTGYLACDGTAYNIADYQALADHINTQFGSYDFFGGDGTTTFAVPDLRGEFLRGTGTNSHTNQGNGSNVGVHQNGTTFIDFLVYTNSSTKVIQIPCNASDTIALSSQDSTIDTKNGLLQISGTYVSASWAQGRAATYTSRPTNTSVLYCIKC